MVGAIADLRRMLWELEVALGLEPLSQHQKDVYYAACLLAKEHDEIRSDAIKNHPMLALMTRPTFFRSLKVLVEKGFLVPSGHGRGCRYSVKR